MADDLTTEVFRPLSETNAGPWEHLDGTPCPHYYASLPRPSASDLWWCTEHQKLVRSVAETAAQAGRDARLVALRAALGDDPWSLSFDEFVRRVNGAVHAPDNTPAATEEADRG